MEAIPVIPPRLGVFAGGAVLLSALWLFAASFLLRWLWNLTMPQTFGLRPLTYWQAFRLLLVAWLLFGGVRLLWGA